MRNVITGALWMAGSSLAAISHIPYAGGLQTGTFDLKGTETVNSDTVILDGGLKVIGFTEAPIPGRFRTQLGYWLLIENTFGPVGAKSSQDTVWTGAITYPAGTLSLDSLSPVPDQIAVGKSFPYNLPSTALGIRIGTKVLGFEGYGIGFDSVQGNRRIVYFRMDRAGGTLYGKLTIHAKDIYRQSGPGFLPDGPQVYLNKAGVAYTLSSSVDLNSGGVVGINPGRIRDGSPTTRRRLIWSERNGVSIQDPGRPGALYDLKGKRRTVPEPAR